MIHKACMPVYMNSGKIVAGGRDGWTSKVLQEVLADLKSNKLPLLMIMGEKTRDANHYLNVNNFDLHVSSFEFLSSMCQ